MFQKESMTMAEALGISLTGIVIVFLTLMALALAIVIVSKIVNSIVKDTPKAKTAQTAQKPTDTIEPAKLAAIVAAVSEEMKTSVENFKIVSIEEKKNGE